MTTPPTFSFGAPASNGSSTPNMFATGSANSKPTTGSLFGQNASTTTAGGSGLFGQVASAPAAGGLFGNVSKAPSSGLAFGSSAAGSAPAQSSLFGAAPSSSGTSAPSMFGASTGNPGSTGGPSMLGGAQNNSSGGGLFSGGSSGTTSPFPTSSGFSFGTKKDETTTTPSQGGFPSLNANKPAVTTAGGLFGSAGQTSGGGLFGNQPGSSAPAGSTTPAPAKGFAFGNSTTPAGLPPADANRPSASNMFGGQQSGGNLFNQQKPVETNPSATSSQQPGGLFGSSKENSGQAAQQSGGLFGNNKDNNGSGAGIFGGTKTAASSTGGPGIFGALGANKPATTSTTAAPSQAALKFGAAPNSSNASNPSTSATSLFGAVKSTSATAAPSLFGATSSATPTTSSAPAPSTGIFGGLNTLSPTTNAASSSAGLGGLLSGTSTSTPATSGASTTAAPAPGVSLFGAKPAEASKTNATPVPSSSASTNPLAASTANPLGASTAGPPPQLSRLKNKTMDEIITRWATDLSKYQKEFQDQAQKVSAWDRLLVDNSEKIQKLYTSTFEAERASAEVERQLASVESQQDELEAWLDQYEKKIHEMSDKQIGSTEGGLQGPDQERERTYKLAEKLTDKLDEMGKDLSNMIQEINTASASLSKTSKPDDPLSQIVRVLNGHLSQLQWIDQNATQLQAKVLAAQKASQTITANGHNGVENDSADDFYRSFMGGSRR